MKKYKLIMHFADGTSDEIEDLFDTEEEASDTGAYYVGCVKTGAEILNASNPGDNPYDEETFVEDDYEVEEVEV